MGTCPRYVLRLPGVTVGSGIPEAVEKEGSMFIYNVGVGGDSGEEDEEEEEVEEEEKDEEDQEEVE